MKCMKCLKDWKYKERSTGCCPDCGTRFALEPRQGDALNDLIIDAAVKAVSSQGKVRWNLENLYYEICRRKPITRQAAGCGCFTFVASTAFLTQIGEGWFDLIAVLASLGLARMAYVSRNTPTLFSKETFNQQWSKWAGVHGVPPTMITPMPVKKLPAAESDLGDYSFDRAVICDRPATVDLLIANNFHFENNCAILSADGYPKHAFETVRNMLNRNPRLKVWVLHDATVDGCMLAQRLQDDSQWFPEGAQIIDVGMRPGNCGPLEKVCLRGEFSVPDSPVLSVQERKWLANRQLELAAIRPEQVIKRLFRSFSTFEAGSGDGGIYMDSSSFSSDASSSDGGGDSFG